MSEFKLKLGLNECSNAEYHSDSDWLGSSGFKRLLKDPQGFYAEYVQGNQTEELQDKWKLLVPSPMRKPSDALSLGSLVHTYILEPHLVDKEYYFFDGRVRRGKAYDAAQAKANETGLTLITESQKELAHKLIDAYNSREAAVRLIADGGFPEQTLCTMLEDIPVKVRADWINPEAGYIVDVKTTADSTDKYTFKQTCEKYGYLLSSSLYSRCFEEYYGKPFRFYFIVLGKTTKLCDVYKIGAESRALGDSRLETALTEYKTRMQQNSWHSYEIEEI